MSAALDLFADRDVKAGPVPAEVLAYWRAKKLTVGFDHRDVWNEEHDYAFSAAKIMRFDVLAAMQQELDRAIRDGVPFEQFKQNVEPRMRALGWWETHEVSDPKTGDTATVNPPARLRTIFQTNMRTARAVGQYARIQRNKRARPYLLYQLGPSIKHREEHVAWHGLLLPVDDPFWGYAFPPNGHGCFLPGTHVTGTVAGASKAWYAGQAVEIELESGARLAVTVNHPVAAAHGWLPAGELREGDYAVSHGVEVEVVRSASAPDASRRAVRNEQIPPRIEDVFESLAAHGTRSTEVSPLDFHGEAQRFVGKIDVVGSYVDLVNHVEATRAERFGHSLFAGTDRDLALEERASHLRALDGSMLAPTGSIPGRLTERDGLSPIHSLPSLLRGVGPAAHRHIAALKKGDNSGAGHAAFLRDAQDRGAGKVALDKIVRVRRFPYSGHVFDLETQSGWLFANGIAASNCKCWVRAVSPREADRLEAEGILAPNPDPVLDDDGNPTGHVLDQRVAVRREAPEIRLVPWENKRTGQTEFVPQGVDPGFHHTPGEARARALKAAE